MKALAYRWRVTKAGAGTADRGHRSHEAAYQLNNRRETSAMIMKPTSIKTITLLRNGKRALDDVDIGQNILNMTIEQNARRLHPEPLQP